MSYALFTSLTIIIAGLAYLLGRKDKDEARSKDTIKALKFLRSPSSSVNKSKWMRD